MFNIKMNTNLMPVVINNIVDIYLLKASCNTHLVKMVLRTIEKNQYKHDCKWR